MSELLLCWSIFGVLFSFVVYGVSTQNKFSNAQKHFLYLLCGPIVFSIRLIWLLLIKFWNKLGKME